MKYDLTQVLRNYRGQTFPEQNQPNGPIIDLTLGAALERAAMFGGKPDDSGDAKYANYKLAKLCSEMSVDAELEAAQVDKLKTLSAAIYSPAAYGSIVDTLEGRATPAPVLSPVELACASEGAKLVGYAGEAQPGDLDDLLKAGGTA